MRPLFQKMAEALRATGRPIVYSLCQYGREKVWQWGPKAGGHLWRTTGDISDRWGSMARIGFGQNDLADFAGPGQWNDPDMLEIGNGGMSGIEYRTHFSLWAILAAPLIAGNDLRSMSAETKEILLNREVIAINQDKLGKQGRRVSKDGATEIWTRPLEGGDLAVAIFNRGEAETTVTFKWQDLNAGVPAKIRDLWAHADRDVAGDACAVKVAAHGAALLRAGN
jgi:alpha-galactosidase